MKKIVLFCIIYILTMVAHSLFHQNACAGSKTSWQCTTIAEVYLMSKPNPAATIVEKVAKGSALQVLAESKDDLSKQNWLKVSYAGKTGWIMEIMVDKIHAPINQVKMPETVQKPGETWIKVITPDNRARLSPIPDSVPQNHKD